MGSSASFGVDGVTLSLAAETVQLIKTVDQYYSATSYLLRAGRKPSLIKNALGLSSHFKARNGFLGVSWGGGTGTFHCGRDGPIDTDCEQTS